MGLLLAQGGQPQQQQQQHQQHQQHQQKPQPQQQQQQQRQKQQHQQKPQKQQQKPQPQQQQQQQQQKQQHQQKPQQQQQPQQKPQQQQPAPKTQSAKGKAPKQPKAGAWTEVVQKPRQPPQVLEQDWGMPVLTGDTGFGSVKMGLKVTLSAREAELACGEMRDAAEEVEGAVGYAVLSTSPFTGGEERLVRLVGGGIRPFYVCKIGAVGHTQPGKVAHAARQEQAPAPATQVLTFTVVKRHTSDGVWDCLVEHPLLGMQKVCRRAVRTACAELGVDSHHMWMLRSQQGRRDIQVRVPTSAVERLLRSSGKDGCFWRALTFREGGESHLVVKLRSEVTRQEAMQAVQRAGELALGLAVGTRALFVRAARKDAVEELRAKLGDAAEEKQVAVPRYVVQGAKPREHAAEVEAELQRAGWPAVVKSSFVAKGGLTCIVAADQPPTFNALSREGQNTLWVRLAERGDTRRNPAKCFVPEKGARRDGRIRLPPRPDLSDEDFPPLGGAVPSTTTSAAKTDDGPTTDPVAAAATAADETVDLEGMDDEEEDVDSDMRRQGKRKRKDDEGPGMMSQAASAMGKVLASLSPLRSRSTPSTGGDGMEHAHTFLRQAVAHPTSFTCGLCKKQLEAGRKRRTCLEPNCTLHACAACTKNSLVDQ